MLALWAARRHGVPMDRTMALVAQRFNTSQNADGSWGYQYRYGGGDPERPAMTCVGLLGLAIGHGLAADQEARENPALQRDHAETVAVVVFHPQFSFLLPLLARAERMQAMDRARKRGSDRRILNGFVALNKLVGEPAGRTEGIVQHDLYFLWSMERVAVLYDLPTVGHKDWYRWGAEMLVANQQPEGNWEKGGYHGNHPTIDTCLALLFLKRANLVADLTTRLPFDPNALTSSIQEQVKRTTPEPPSSKVAKSTPKTPAAIPDNSPAPEPSPAKSPSKREVASPAQGESAAISEEAQTAGKRGWLWLLVALALVLFIACGILLTGYSLARQRKKERPRWKRYARIRPRTPQQSAKHTKR
jgi:hypothetical protein